MNDKSLDDLLRSPTLSPPLPSSPCPAYSPSPAGHGTVPYRDEAYHLAPLLDGRPGEVELETIDGKRFLVHKKVLEDETVFFHIYYGFIPVWRLHGHVSPSSASLPPHPAFPPSSHNGGHPSSASTLDNLLCLPKSLLSSLRGIQVPPRPTLSSAPSTCSTSSSASSDPPPPFAEVGPPAPPPKDVTAPTPTTSPYTWLVPEPSSVLHAFLALIYPSSSSTFPAPPTPPSLELTGRVIRAALGYQSQRALNAARHQMAGWVDVHPVEVYAMATFFKFTDLAKLASMRALAVPREAWSRDARVLMGRAGANKLEELQRTRLEGLKQILGGGMASDAHSEGCVRRGMIEGVWQAKVREVEEGLKPDSELLELLRVDLRGGHCGDCMLLLGETIQRCLLAAKELPGSI